MIRLKEIITLLINDYEVYYKGQYIDEYTNQIPITLDSRYSWLKDSEVTEIDTDENRSGEEHIISIYTK